MLGPVESEAGQQKHRDRSAARQAGLESRVGYLRFDGVWSQGVEADNAWASFEQVCRRSAGSLIRSCEPREPLVEGSDTAIEGAEVVVTAQALNWPESLFTENGGIV